MNSKNDVPGAIEHLDSEPVLPSEPGSVRKKVNVGRLLLIGGFVLLVLLFLLLHTPGRYRPVTPENPSEVSKYLTHHLAPDLNNKIQLDEPFTMVVDERGFNDIISRGMWPLDRGYVEVRYPAVEFEEDSIVIMAAVSFSSVGSVISAAFSPRLDEDGSLYLNLRYVKMGSVRVTVFARSLVRKIIAEHLEGVEDSQWGREISEAILENKPFDPVFVAYDKKIRLERLDIQPGNCSLTFNPELEK